MRMLAIFLLGCIVVGLCLPFGTASKANPKCPALEEIKKLPMKGEPGVDAVYDFYMREAGCDEFLLTKVLSDTRLDSPGCFRPPEFAEGDMATFLLMDKFGLGLKDILPPDRHDSVDESGVLAYYNFVRDSSGRVYVQDRVREHMDGKAE